MSQYPGSSSKRLMPILLGASILGGGLISVAVALHTHDRSTQASAPIASSTVIASPTAPIAKSILSEASRNSSPNSSPTQTVNQAAPAAVVPTKGRPVDTFQTADLPSVGTVKEMVAGDLMCYLTVHDERGVTRRMGATFEVCQQTNFLNQRVRFSYEPTSVSDCESAEACGKSRSALLVSRMALVDANSPSGANPNSTNSNQSADRYTLSNGEWTITVGNVQSWSGVNNTGDLSYDGCNSKNECLQLQGGKMTCRNGICAIGWRNGDYLYALESPMSEGDSTARQTEATTLTVRQGDTVILQASGFKKI